MGRGENRPEIIFRGPIELGGAGKTVAVPPALFPTDAQGALIVDQDGDEMLRLVQVRSRL